MRSKVITEIPARVPPEAVRKHISSEVVVEVVLDVQGNIKECKSVEGDPILSAAALEAMRKWRFLPTTLDGDPVEVVLKIPYKFEIH